MFKKAKNIVGTGLILGGGAVVLSKFGSATGQTGITDPVASGLGTAASIAIPIMGLEMGVSSLNKMHKKNKGRWLI